MMGLTGAAHMLPVVFRSSCSAQCETLYIIIELCDEQVHVCVCMYVSMYVRMHIMFVCMYVRMYVCTYYVCTYVCTYVCI